MLFKNKIERYKETGHAIIYIDESGFAHDMPRTHGYSIRGKRCYGTQDWQARGRTNVIGAMLEKSLLCVGLFIGNINSNVFHHWVIKELIPSVPQKAVIVMDNASFHKREDTKKAFIDADLILEYLPPYSPDLNPIENKWAQAKAIRRAHNCNMEELFVKFIN